MVQSHLVPPRILNTCSFFTSRGIPGYLDPARSCPETKIWVRGMFRFFTVSNEIISRKYLSTWRKHPSYRVTLFGNTNFISMGFTFISKQNVFVSHQGTTAYYQVVVNQKLILEKPAAEQNAQPTNSDARRREQRFALPRARRHKALFFFLVAQDRKLPLSGCPGRAEETLKRHVRNSSGDAAMEVSSVSSVVLLVRSGFVIVGRSSRPTNK